VGGAAASEAVLTRLLPAPPRRFRTTIITNADDGSSEVMERVIEAGAETAQERPLQLSFPLGVFSLSHVALPFPPNDGLYGYDPDPADDFGIQLGAIAPRGEVGALIVSLDSLVRMSSNPFFRTCSHESRRASARRPTPPCLPSRDATSAREAFLLGEGAIHLLREQLRELPAEVLAARVEEIAGARQVDGDRRLDPPGAGREDHHLVGERHRLVDMVGDEHDRGRGLAPDLDEEALHLCPRLDVEGGEGLVHQEHLPPHGKCPRHRNPLAHAARELVRTLVGGIAQPHRGKHFPRHAAALVLADPLRARPKATFCQTVSQGKSEVS
jgi:hypothetical protein